MLFNQIDGSLGANALDSPTVVTAQEDAQVYELTWKNQREAIKQGPKYTHTHTTQLLMFWFLKIIRFCSKRTTKTFTCSLVRPISCRIREKWNSWMGSFLKQRIHGLTFFSYLFKGQVHSNSITSCFYYYVSSYFASLAVRCLRRTLVPKVSPSISSVAVANTFPALARAAQLASASQGA